MCDFTSLLVLEGLSPIFYSKASGWLDLKTDADSGSRLEDWFFDPGAKLSCFSSFDFSGMSIGDLLQKRLYCWEEEPGSLDV